jgi:transposase
LAETMTVAGFDVHARSIDGAAVHVPTGELVRIRFGGGVDGPIEWLRSLSGPVRACYDAGPTGFGLYRAAVAAGIDMRVVAPGKTPRGGRIGSRPIARTPSCWPGYCWPGR